jgi:hypothetical protein
MLRPGTVVAGRYKVVRHVGSGAMGSVHLAVDETLHREVAVKSVHADPESDHGRRVMREARIGAGLRHPHLVTVYDVSTEDDSIVLVTEYVEGETLADALRRGALDDGRAVEVLRAVASALDEAHARGVVHRDVKPANILLGTGGAVKLADLGIATAADSTRITRTGASPGTLAYMAPEQFEDGPATSAADVYALAAVAYEALTGRRVHEGGTAFARPSAPPDVADLPPRVGEVLLRGMARDPAARPSSAGALVDDLAAALGTAPPVAPRPPETHVHERGPSPKLRGAVVPLALLAIVGAAGVLVAIAVGGGDEDEPQPRARGPAATASTRPQPAPESGPPTPAAAVQDFYMGLADGSVRAAWRLAGPRFRGEYGDSFAAFADGFASLRGIRFERLDEVKTEARRATVALQTVAEHTDRTERCTGTVQTVLLDGRWRVEPYGVSCEPAG